MKFFAVSLILASSTVALATSPEFESRCMIKQKNAASMELAQSEARPVQSTKVVKFQHGPWDEMPGENSGMDAVTVTLETKSGTRIATYKVEAKQIGMSDDCNIVKVSEYEK